MRAINIQLPWRQKKAGFEINKLSLKTYIGDKGGGVYENC
jgi:hypothetical protein